MTEKLGIPQGQMRSLDYEIRTLAADSIKRSGKSREQIAEGMAALMGCQMTVHMLNGFTAQSKEAIRFPAAHILAFCEVTADDRLQRFLAGPRLLKLIEFAERELAALSDERDRHALRDELLAQSPGGTACEEARAQRVQLIKR